jgi:hypothetical protein
LRGCFDPDLLAADQLVVQRPDGRASFGVFGHLDKSKAFRLSAPSFRYEVMRAHLPERQKHFEQLFFSYKTRQVSDNHIHLRLL